MVDKYQTKHVLILVLSIVAGIAFIETSSPVWTGTFWREFLLKLFLYGAVAEVVAIGLGTMLGNKRQ